MNNALKASQTACLSLQCSGLFWAAGSLQPRGIALHLVTDWSWRILAAEDAPAPPKGSQLHRSSTDLSAGEEAEMPPSDECSPPNLTPRVVHCARRPGRKVGTGYFTGSDSGSEILSLPSGIKAFFNCLFCHLIRHLISSFLYSATFLMSFTEYNSHALW